MNIKYNKIIELSNKYNIDEFEIYNILYKSIAKNFNATTAVIYNDFICLCYVYEDFKVETKRIIISKKTVFNILKEFLKELSIYSSSSNFYRFFTKDRIYKARALSLKNNNISIEILNNDKSKLFHFFIPIEQLNYQAIKNIQNRTFFDKEYNFYVGIIKKIDDENIMCGMFNPRFLKNVFMLTFYFLLKKYQKRYGLESLNVKIDYGSKQISYFCKFNKRHRAGYKFIGLIERLLEKKIGRVRVYLV